MEKEPKKETPDKTLEYLAKDLIYMFPKRDFTDPSELRDAISATREGPVTEDLLSAVQKQILGLKLKNEGGETADNNPSLLPK